PASTLQPHGPETLPKRPTRHVTRSPQPHQGQPPQLPPEAQERPHQARQARTWEREQRRRIAAPTPAEVAAQRSPRQPVRSYPFCGYETESTSEPSTTPRRRQVLQ